MNIAIIDDEKDARIVINSLVSKYIQEENTIYEADGVNSGAALLSSTEIDLVFLDIQINGGTGFDLLNKLEIKNFKLIFTTAYDEHAIKAFKYAAIDYLLKPIEPDDFKSAIKKATKAISIEEMSQRIKHLETIASENAFNKIACPSSDGTKYIEIIDIIHLESSGNYTILYSNHEYRQVICRLLKDCEQLLPENIFYRIHKSHIIQLKLIKQINHKDNTVTMINGNVIPIARRRKEDLMKMIG